MGYDEWSTLLRDLALIGQDLTARDATLCFVWSRMIAAQPDTVKGEVKVRNLGFEDFLEAIVRVSTLKALPTDEEIIAANFNDAGEYMLEMAREGVVSGLLGTLYYEDFMERQAPWGVPLHQPVWRSVEHLLSMCVRVVQQATGDERDDLTVSHKDLARFMKLGKHALQ